MCVWFIGIYPVESNSFRDLTWFNYQLMESAINVRDVLNHVKSNAIFSYVQLVEMYHPVLEKARRYNPFKGTALQRETFEIHHKNWFPRHIECNVWGIYPCRRQKHSPSGKGSMSGRLSMISMCRFHVGNHFFPHPYIQHPSRNPGKVRGLHSWDLGVMNSHGKSYSRPIKTTVCKAV